MVGVGQVRGSGVEGRGGVFSGEWILGRIENAMGSRLISGTSMNKIIEISICMQGGNHSQSTAGSQVEPYLDPS